MNVVIMVTIPMIGNMLVEMAPICCPVFATTKDISARADDIPSPVLRTIFLSYPILSNTTLIINNFEANVVTIRIKAGRIRNGICDISMRAPIEIKNSAANTSLNGTVTTLAIAALFDSATSTPARNAPVATDNSRDDARKDNPKAKPSIEIRSKA
jgi:hypothetical protein